MRAAEPLPFRFSAVDHEYVALDTGEVYPHITGLLQKAGLVDDRWYTPESRTRGTAVHRLTTDYDLGALEDVDGCTSRYKGWLHAHVACMNALRPVVLQVEQPIVHPHYRFGGRPDRIVRLFGVRGPFEIKSGGPEKAHAIQTALQAILDSMDAGIPADVLGRWAAYYQENGKYRVEAFTDRRDIDTALKILKEYA